MTQPKIPLHELVIIVIWTAIGIALAVGVITLVVP